jgi:mRNA-degrading endonuclease toxin of MazEF toxin-antitoxin module
MAYTFVLDGTDEQQRIAFVRDEIDDVTETGSPVQGRDYFLSDERILARLASAKEEAPSDANETEVRLMACAAILDTLATNQAYQLKVGRTLGEERDGKAVAEAIRAHATALRKRASGSLTDRRAEAAKVEAQQKLAAAPRSRGFKTVPQL